MNCYKCDTLLDKNWNYCPNCKKKIKKIKHDVSFEATDDAGKCHTCSCELNDNWNFCPICGTSVDFYENEVKIEIPTLISDSNKKVAATAFDVELKEKKGNEQVKEYPVGYIFSCRACGALLQEPHKFCSVCGTSAEQNFELPKEELAEEDKCPSFYLLLSLLIPAISFIISIFVDTIKFISLSMNISGLISLVWTIYLLIRYRKDKDVRLYFILYFIFGLFIGAPFLYILYLSAHCSF